jgi:hypothetical protein
MRLFNPSMEALVSHSARSPTYRHQVHNIDTKVSVGCCDAEKTDRGIKAQGLLDNSKMPQCRWTPKPQGLLRNQNRYNIFIIHGSLEEQNQQNAYNRGD